MATYLVRFSEVGRDRQPGRQKLRRDLAAVIGQQIPDARIEQAPGRLVVDAAPDLAGVLAALPGVACVSPCERVAERELEQAVVTFARRRLAPGTGRQFAIRVARRNGDLGGAAADSRATDLAGQLGDDRHDVAAERRSPEIARQLGDAVVAATGARVDLAHPDVTIRVELRGGAAYIFDRTIDGIDRAGPTTARAPGEPRFVADQMLGRLAARLRLLGYDTLTVYDLADSEVTRLAAADGRILLTRDGELARTRAVPVHRVVATEPRAQLAEVIAALSLAPDPDRMFSRCTLCNALVAPIAEADIRDGLPPGVRGRGLAFARCSHCAHLYWHGSHVTRILAELRAAGVVVEPPRP